MISKKEPSYIMPAGYRKMENMHIIFWLMKDVSWCMIWKPIGIVMIFPTLIISIIIAWRTREIRSELAHNLAITFWIVANSYWMISEFFGFDEKIFFWGIDGRHLTIVPFTAGVLTLLYYYVFQRAKVEAKETQVATL